MNRKHTREPETRWALEKLAKKTFPVEKYPKISTPLGNRPVILSPFEIECEKLHIKTIPIGVFELETIDFLSPLDFDRNFHPYGGKKIHRGTETGMYELTTANSSYKLEPL